ncbi:MAG: TonB-dependent receptor plug domain-containing protein [Cytophagales bacterium]|nr:TonB-dependent receptor plug domain-containing protein [Cytophagales bacterium]
MKYIIFIFLLLITASHIFSQNIIKGIVIDKQNNSVFAANVYLKNLPEKGVVTNFDGRFELIIPSKSNKDTLIVSFIGYETKKIPISFISHNEVVKIVLSENKQTLMEVIITAQDPISEQFSVTKLEKLDVYLNPVSNGDPLKAITSLPASTNTEESANPSLRGSSSDRTRVILNGVPVYRPVRNSQINGIGNFSLFNTEIIHKQYVYASNPPLTYGNTSAGLVEIETIKELYHNQLQLSAGLANAGVFLSQKIKKKTFVQVYGNYQFSDGFISLNKKNFPRLNDFNTKDIGLNFHSNINKKTSINIFSYLINEAVNVNTEFFTYKGRTIAEKRRNFNIINFKYITKNGIANLNNGTNFSKTNFIFGNINSENNTKQVYSSFDYKWFILDNTTLQMGISHDYSNNKFKDSIPFYYYALSPESPNFYSDTTISNQNLESYYYLTWDVNDKLIFSSGMRANIPIEKQKFYLSSQLGIKYKINQKHSFLLSGGKYHNYSSPAVFSKNYNLLKSYQAALDYSYTHKNTLVNVAAFYKNESGEKINSEFITIDNTETFGIELNYEQFFKKYFKFSIANTFLDQTIKINNKKYNGAIDLNYFIKTTISYNNPKIFNLALTYIVRPGKFYTTVLTSTFDNGTNFYEPVFSDVINGNQYNSYNNISISISQYYQFKKTALIGFASINNILSTKNQSEVLFSKDYSKHTFDYYQLRTIYFGVVWQLNY